MAIQKIISEDQELYLYMNGKLLLKRWEYLDCSQVFDDFMRGNSTYMSIVEDKYGRVRCRRKILIHGEYCHTKSDFWKRYTEQISKENVQGFGENLDAFDDAITSGGPGCPGDCIITITGVKQLEKIFGTEDFQWMLDLLKGEDYIDLVLPHENK